MLVQKLTNLLNKETNLPPDTKWFEDSPDVGPECFCSKCGYPIFASAIRFTYTPENEDDPLYEKGLEARFHPSCLGMKAVS